MSQITLDELRSLSFSRVIERGTIADFESAYNYMVIMGWEAVGSINVTMSPFPNAQGNFVQSYSILMSNPAAWAKLEEYKRQQLSS